MSAAACAHETPQARLMELINASWTTQAIATACELDLPDRLADRGRTPADLAREAGADPDALSRLLRALVTLEVCEELDADTFALGSLGHLLRREHAHGLRHWALLNGGPLWARWGALSTKIREGGRAGQGQGSAARFARLEADGLEAAHFYGAMTELSRRLVPSVTNVVSVPENGLIIDVGGGTGELLANLLVRHPKARGLLYDLSTALEHARPVLSHHGVSERCELRHGSFFDEVPSHGDLYVMKSVLHDWDDEHAIRLLSRCREAMASAASLVIVERLLPERVRAMPEHQAVVRSDLNMLVGLAGRERCLAQYVSILQQVGLVLVGEKALGAGFSALEVAIPRPAI
jgi:orsellinic acid C2-O-methyltransferase